MSSSRTACIASKNRWNIVRRLRTKSTETGDTTGSFPTGGLASSDSILPSDESGRKKFPYDSKA
ncbi:MAG: hypothetical protein ACPHCI_07175, partial [Solirubrobacterales bacterium]